jgi:glycosyltransferase involved in cell wall biosynthesis
VAEFKGISCIIPTLNRGEVLLATVKQLFAQDSPPAEIIVVDQTQNVDSSTCSTLQSWKDQGLIRWVRQAEPNASKARNAGALTATGDVLLFLDDDISIGPGLLRTYRAAFADPAVVGVAGQILEGGRNVQNALSEAAMDPETGWLHFPKNYGRRCETSWMASGNFAVRRDIYFRVGGMDENYLKGAFREESDFAMRFRNAGHIFVFEPLATLYHLGAAGAPIGGSRTFLRHRDMSGWHHCVGDWYFTFGYATIHTWPKFLWASLRHFVCSRKHWRKPYWLLINVAMWILALPIGLLQRLRGPRFLRASQYTREG